MKKILNIYKPIGHTPLQLVNKLKGSETEYRELKIGYAGRLDPLAHGVMLLMIGNETKNREKYLNLDKEYEFEVLFGVSTDTYDALGIIQQSHNRADWDKEKIDSHIRGNDKSDSLNSNLKIRINQFINSKLGIQIQSYPPFSSIEVAGKPLYQWARDGKLSEIKIPEKEIEIYSFELLDTSQITSEEIESRIVKNITLVKGDFRQNEILKKWNDFFKKNKSKTPTVVKFRISCSSGTYVRSIANDLGTLLGCGAIALDILRIRVGEYELKDSIRL